MTPENQEAVVREFVRSFNERDIDAFADTLDRDVELHSMRGLIQGVDAARTWATRAPGGVQQTVVVNEVESVDNRFLLRIRRDWHWDEDGSPAGDDEMAWYFELRDGRIAVWRPFLDPAEAVAAFNAD